MSALIACGCAVVNSDYGGESGTESAGGTGAATSSADSVDPTAASGSASMSSAGTTAGSSQSGSGPDTESDSGPSTTGDTDDTVGTTHGDSSGGVGESSTATTDTSGEPATAVVIFATEPLPGAFSKGQMVPIAGAAACNQTATEVGFGFDCIAMVPIIATAGFSFTDLAGATPELEELPLISPQEVELADSFGGLIANEVIPQFADEITDHLGAPNDPSFWWGPQEKGQPDCEGWSSPGGTGRTRVYDSAGSGMLLHGMNSCTQLHHLMCACLVNY